MTTTTDIANHALSLVSEKRLVSMDSPGELAAVVKLHLASSVREVLSNFPWRCARRRATLARLATPPAFGWRHQYQLPADFLRVVSINGSLCGSENRTIFEVEGTVLLTNADNCQIVYVYDILQGGLDSNIGELDALCAEAIYTKLAIALSYTLTQNLQREQVLRSAYETVSQRARSKSQRDALENTVPFYEGETVTASRHGALPFATHHFPFTTF
ncbi:MAG: hypothetical protein LBT53_03350 [Puniceicoccales bacterium]|jgi:hypothetical protein|nr:hypothetical protein [Puniceicoccales bacterium]